MKKKQPIHKKLFLSFCCFALIPVLAIGIGSVYISFRISMNNTEIGLKDTANQIGSMVDGRLEENEVYFREPCRKYNDKKTVERTYIRTKSIGTECQGGGDQQHEYQKRILYYTLRYPWTNFTKLADRWYDL